MTPTRLHQLQFQAQHNGLTEAAVARAAREGRESAVEGAMIVVSPGEMLELLGDSHE